MKPRRFRRRLAAFATAVAAFGGTLAGAMALSTSPASAGTNGTVTYEADCTSTLQTGIAAPFVEGLNATGAPDPSFPTGATFGVAGAATETLPGPIIAGVEQALNPATIGTSLSETLGSTDATATGTFAYSHTFPSVAPLGRQITGVTWTSGSTTLTGTGFVAGDVGAFVAGPSGGGISPQATISSVSATGAVISVATTAAEATASTIGTGNNMTMTDTSLSTGNVFTTAGVNGGKANIGVIGVTSVSIITPAVTVPFGGAQGVGTANCLLTGWQSATPANIAGPAQTNETAPALPAGATSFLVAATGGHIAQPGTTVLITPPAAAFVGLVDPGPVTSNSSVSMGVGGTKTVTLPATDTDATPVASCALVGTPPFGTPARLNVTISNTPTPCQATLTDTGTAVGTVTFNFTALDTGGNASTPAGGSTVTVTLGTPPVDQPINQQVNPGNLVLSCSAPGSAGYPALTCPVINLPAITLNGTTQTATSPANPIFVSDNRGDPTVGWTLSTYMVVTPSNTNGSCASSPNFCNSTVAASFTTNANAHIPASDLAISSVACAPATGNPNPAPTASTGGSFGSVAPGLTLCTAAAGSSGGTFTANGTFTLTIPPSVFSGLYKGTVEYLVT